SQTREAPPNKMPDQLYRRHLPHWRLDHATYFVTWRLAKGQPELDSTERALVTSAIKKFDRQRYELSAYVVMDDHIHVLLSPIEPHELKDILHTWKSYTARQMQLDHKRSGAIWQNEYFDRIIRDEREFTQKSDYIMGNPQKR